MKIVIHIHGGVLQDVLTDSTESIQCVLIDDDNLEAEGIDEEEQDRRYKKETKGLRVIF